MKPECVMVDGSVVTNYRGDDLLIYKSTDPIVRSGEVIDRQLCCLAYDEDGEINNSFELVLACEEIQVANITYTYDPENVQCIETNESFIYVDLDANELYDQIIDGDYFDYSILDTPTDTLDPCCQDAIDRDNVADAQESCPFC